MKKIRNVALAALITWFVVSASTNAAQEPSAAEKLQQATKNLKEAKDKFEKAEEEFNKAAEEAFGEDGFAKDSIRPYETAIKDAERDKAVWSGKVKQAYDKAVLLNANPLIDTATKKEAMDDFQTFLDIFHAREQAVETAQDTFYEKVRDFLQQFGPQINPNQPTVVEKLDQAQNDLNWAKKDLDEAQKLEEAENAKKAGRAGRTSNVPGTDALLGGALGAAVTGEDAKTAGTPSPAPGPTKVGEQKSAYRRPPMTPYMTEEKEPARMDPMAPYMSLPMGLEREKQEREKKFRDDREPRK
jgi:tetratricopeptide (TPR) repeat protein